MFGNRQHIFSGAMLEELSGFSQAVVMGDLVFVSGTVGIDPETGELAQGVEAQTELALAAIGAALRDANSGLQDIVRLRNFVVDPKDVNSVAQVLQRRVGMYYPAKTTLCTNLTTPGALVEIEVDAVRNSGPTPT